MKSERDFTFFCVGLGVGVATAFLCAPKSGAETRKQIRDAANDGSSYLKQQAANAAEAAADFTDRSAKTVRHHKENVMAAVDAGKDAYRDAVASMPASDFKL
jgi:gas vesicle protein